MSEKKSKKSSAFEWIKAIIIAVGLALVIRIFLFEPYLVEGASMNPTLHDGERLFVNKTIGFTNHFNRGDIVIINGEENGLHYVKRIVGLPGDTIEMNDDVLTINGEEVEEEYLDENRQEAEQIGLLLTDNFGPQEIPEGNYFVMGDNRLNSMDSRNGLGFIDEARIIGRSEFVFFPIGEIRRTN
ncbi:signal peptidase I [Bacillus lacus]|uniref:Signal peptidase I n=1 Tax=Metabacillus lacus TaxID=1983721 RepID=A0A7X2IXS4_9BACI|nr:signal peptidase I [Metabacillus lacus]